MITKRELKDTTKMVRLVLDQDERARNSDSYLYCRVIGIWGKDKGINVDQMSIVGFLQSANEMKAPKFESVRRARQKLQAKHPELAANRNVISGRTEAEIIYRDYARCN